MHKPASRVLCLVTVACVSQLALPAKAQSTVTLSAEVSTTVSVSKNTSITKEVSLRAETVATTSPVDERREQIMAAVVADDFRERISGPPTVYHELSQSAPSPSQQRTRRAQPPSVKPYVPTAQLVTSPWGRQPSGSLSGRIMFCSAGHGWTNDTTSSLWYTQRPITHGIVEDLANLDQVNMFADACFRAGATVVSLRPLGHQTIERIVDNARTSNAHFEGPWYDSDSATCYGAPDDPPPYRFAIASTDENALARYQPYLPKSDFYPVYCWARDGADRVDQTYRIVHSGGATQVRVNHRRVGKGWVYLGEYHFEKGWDGFVEITNHVENPEDADGKHVVVADAIRFGNGMGDVNRGGGISGHPREEEASRYWVERSLSQNTAPIYAALKTGDQNDNVGAAPRMAAQMNRELEGTYTDRLFLSYHSNAAGGRGVVGLFDESPDMRPDHQVEWARIIARQFNEDMTTTGIAEIGIPWVVRARLTDSHINFGEIRRDYIHNEMCATIIEAAFHDNALDAVFLRNPSVRRVMARSSLKAALKYFQQFDPAHPSWTLEPEPPVILCALADPATSAVKVQWTVPPAVPAGGDPPSEYRVYHSTNGFGFDGGVDAGDSSEMVFRDLEPGNTHYFRVTAINKGGESLPSRTLGAVWFTSAPQTIAVVTAFSTFDSDLDLTQTEEMGLGSAFAHGGSFVRIVPRLMNAGNYVVQAGDAILTAGRSFDSYTVEGLSAAAQALRPYQATVILYGRQSPRDGIFGADFQTTITSYLNRGGSLFVSGANVLSALDDKTTRPDPGSRHFAAHELHARFAADDAGCFTVRPVQDFRLPLPTLALDDGSAGIYVAASCDAIAPSHDSLPLFRYADAARSVAAIRYKARSGRGNVVLFGFPFETIVDRTKRGDVMTYVLDFLGSPRTCIGPDQVTQPRGKTRTPARKSRKRS